MFAMNEVSLYRGTFSHTFYYCKGEEYRSSYRAGLRYIEARQIQVPLYIHNYIYTMPNTTIDH